MRDAVAYRRIVAATDFSDCSAAALAWAKAIARTFHSELTLVHANAITPLIEGVPANLGYTVEYQLDGAWKALDQFAATQLADVPSARKLVVTGAAADSIVSTARTVGADLIVMGTRGATGVGRVLLGSVAESVIRHADRPVLTIRCNVPGADRESRLFRRILCPVQLSDRSIASFRHALAIASAFDAELLVVHVGEDTQGVFDVDAEAARLRSWVGDVPAAVNMKLLVNRGNPADEVVAYAREHDIDLLVAGARRKSTGSKTVLGSTTEMLTRHAPCPVMTVPADDAGKE
jgi:nucleotide-binding universal stress UspA family protein